MGDQHTKVGKRNSLHSVPSSNETGASDSWHRDESTVSSAAGSSPGRDTTSGSLNLSGQRIREELGREILHRRFTTFGAKVQTDFAFHMGEVLCTLDGYDPDLRVGYAYISHADADVVTDMDADTEVSLHQLMMEHKAFILVVHDSQIPSAEELVIHIDKFLHALPPGVSPHRG